MVNQRFIRFVRFIFNVQLLFTVIFISQSKSQVLNFNGGIGRGDKNIASNLISLSGNLMIVNYGGGIGGGSSTKGTNKILFNGSVSILYFSGGNGFGSAQSRKSDIFLNGNPSRLDFSGGLGAGSSYVKTASLFLNGQRSAIDFYGGIGTGDDNASIALSSLNGVISQGGFIPLGGTGRGDAFLKSALIGLSGNSNIVQFVGGIGSGSSKSVIDLVTLSGVVPMILFSGGIGSGTVKSSGFQLSTINGVPFVLVFSGGNGRGNIVFKSNSARLNGLASAASVRMATTQVLSLSATQKRDNVLLSWKTSNSSNIQRFNIQNSDDGSYFYSVGQIIRDGFVDESEYLFNHSTYSKGKDQFFRIVAENYDSSFVYSDVLNLNHDEQLEQITLHPNPATNIISINFSQNSIDEEKQLSVFSLSGKKFITKIQSGNRNKSILYVDDLPLGVYFLEVQSHSISKRIKFVKQ